MFNPLGSIGRSLINPMTLAQVAMGPAGWASIAMRTIGTAIGQQLIQQVGQRLGLPPALISMAQNSFAAATGSQGFPRSINEAVSQLGGQYGLSAAMEGALSRSAKIDFNNLMRDVMGSDEYKAAKSGGGKGFLERLAVALGKALDQKMNKAASLADQIGKQGDSSQSKLGELNGKLSAVTQEIGILSQALNNTIKSIGEAQATLARKN